MNQNNFWDGYHQGVTDQGTNRRAYQSGRQIGNVVVQLVIGVVSGITWILMKILAVLWKGGRWISGLLFR